MEKVKSCPDCGMKYSHEVDHFLSGCLREGAKTAA